MSEDWKIADPAAPWDCDWEGSERFHLRTFRALSFSDKVRAVEHMCEVAGYFARRAHARQANQNRG